MRHFKRVDHHKVTLSPILDETPWRAPFRLQGLIVPMTPWHEGTAIRRVALPVSGVQEFMMAKAETDNDALRVDNDRPIRKEPHILLRLAGLAVSLAVIAAAIIWASSL